MEIDNSESPVNKEDNDAERENFLIVLSAYKNYKIDWNKKIQKRLNFIQCLPKSRDFLENYLVELRRISKHISDNNRIINSMIKNADMLFNNYEENKIDEKELDSKISKNYDTEKVTIVLKQIVRDWGLPGLEERESCYNPIISTLLEYFNPSDT